MQIVSVLLLEVTGRQVKGAAWVTPSAWLLAIYVADCEPRFGIRIIAWTIKNWLDFKGVLGIFLFLFCRFPSLHLFQKAVFLAIMCLFSPVEGTSPRARLLHCLGIL